MLRWFETRIDPFRKPPAKDPPPKVLAFYWHFIRQAPLPIVVLLFMSGVSTVLELLVFVQLGRAVDVIAGGGSAVIGEAVEPLLWSIPALLLASLVCTCFYYFVANQMISIPWINQMRWQSHQRVVRRRLRFFQNESSGRIATHVHETGQTIWSSIAGTIQSLWSIAILLAGASVIFVGLNAAFLVPVVLWVAASIAVLIYLVPRTRKASEAQLEHRSLLQGRIVDAYSNIAVVKIFGGGAQEDGHIRQGIGNLIAAAQRAMRLQTFQVAVLLAINSLLIGSVFLMALIVASRGLMPVGDIVVATALVLRLQNFSYAIIGGVSNLAANIGTVENGMKSIAPKEPDRVAPAATGFVIRDGAVVFDKVKFAYPGGERVLDGLSLEVPKRRSLGVVGLSGAGKSTILNLLAGLYELDSGSIRIDGRDIGTMSEAELWAGISVVTQDPQLFNRSVRDNVRYARPDATDAEVEDALAKASAREFVSKLSDNEGRRDLDAHIGERGAKLSGGQRQRLAIARALLKDAPILILDEPTAALDSETEAAIQTTLSALRQTRTLLVIAHRVSTIADLDRIIVLDKGKIAEEGTHDELVAMQGIYHGFWRRQSEARRANEMLAAATAAE